MRDVVNDNKNRKNVVHVRQKTSRHNIRTCDDRDIVDYIKVLRLRWQGMGDKQLPRRETIRGSQKCRNTLNALEKQRQRCEKLAARDRLRSDRTVVPREVEELK